MQSAGGSKGGIAKFFRCGNRQDDVVGRKLLGDVDEVDTDAGYGELVVTVVGWTLELTLQ